MMIKELHPHLTPDIFPAEVKNDIYRQDSRGRKTLSQSNEKDD